MSLIPDQLDSVVTQKDMVLLLSIEMLVLNEQYLVCYHSFVVQLSAVEGVLL